jgi:hypothetical protein
MSFLDNITDMAKNAMGTVTSVSSASTVTASLTKIAEEIQANPMALVQNPMAMVDKLKAMIPMDQLKQASGMVAMLPLPQEVKDGLTKLIDMATQAPEVVKAEESEVTEDAPVIETEAPTMEAVPAMPETAVEVPAMPETPAVEVEPTAATDAKVDM